MNRIPTPSQTVGPFFSLGLLPEPMNVLAGEGERIRIEGVVLDGDEERVPDAMIEIWQPDSTGTYPNGSHPGFTGFARAGTDDDGRYWFETVKPGGTDAYAPHINMHVFARGLLDHLTTRMYFSDEAANESDPILGAVPEQRRATLVAERTQRGDVGVYRFDIVLQGQRETVFFDP